MYSSLLLLFHVFNPYVSSELIVDHDQTWLDDFILDPSGSNGWNIHKISGDDIPIPNPIIFISNTPKYHGPFPSHYNMERYLQCNTTNNARLFVSMLSSYCNTDKKRDYISFTISDPSNTSIFPSFPPYRLNQYYKLLNTNHIPFVHNATSYYYTNHSSSTTLKPQCAEQQWFTANTYKTYEITIIGGNIYKITISFILTQPKDEYVIISDIAMLCVNIPTIYPTLSPTVSRSTTHPPFISTNFPIIYESTYHLSWINTTMKRIYTVNEHDNFIKQLTSTTVLYYVGAILLAITCCSICSVGPVCIWMHLKLQTLYSVNQCNAYRHNSRLADDIGDEYSEHDTESTHFENSDAASIDCNGEELDEGTPYDDAHTLSLLNVNIIENDDACSVSKDNSQVTVDGYGRDRCYTK